MLLVLGSSLDDQPRGLVERWLHAGRDVALVTPEDLSRPGWRIHRGHPAEATAAVGHRLIRANEIDGVISALPWVGQYDVSHIVEEDREYVAQEMTAFLLSWLHEVECPVLDKPSSLSLSGCGRSKQEWAALARRLAIGSEPAWPNATLAVTVVGGAAVTSAPKALARAAEMLSGDAGRSLVTFRFADDPAPILVGADVRAEINSSAVANALLDVLDLS